MRTNDVNEHVSQCQSIATIVHMKKTSNVSFEIWVEWIFLIRLNSKLSHALYAAMVLKCGKNLLHAAGREACAI